MIDGELYDDCLGYIDSHWERLTCFTPADDGLIIGLPHPFVSPSRVEFDGKMYYWDSYFTNLGLLAGGHVALARGMADNLIHLFERFSFIPQSNRFYHLGKSNPPFLTSIISDLFDHTGDRHWLRRASAVATAEYEQRWLGPNRLTSNGLSRYWEPTHTHEQAEDESGWDRTSRFLDRCLDINPVDLNCLLYQYEMDLARFETVLGNGPRAEDWQRRARRRKRLVRRFCWNDRLGFFFDYDHQAMRQTRVWSLAGFFPLWTGLASRPQARQVRDKLRHFEQRGGLATTRRVYLKGVRRQWDYPTGWPNLHWIVIQGLRRYRYGEDAERVAGKWLDTCASVFRKTGKLWEKYDVVKRRPSRIGRYETQSGFGWTNGVFVKLVHELGGGPVASSRMS
jgi:alpha,alpha-trehalase